MKSRTFSVHFMAALLLSFLFLLPIGTVLSFAENADSSHAYIVDQAGVLSDTEQKEINTKLQEFRDANQFDLVIVTTTGLDPDDRQTYADDFYDYNGYGYGDNRDGILFLVNVNDDGSYESGNSWISTCGSGISLFPYSTIQEMGQVLTPYLIAGNYTTAFQQFVTLSKAQYNSGSYGDGWEDDDWADNWDDSWNQNDSWNEDQSFSAGSSGWDAKVIVIAALVVGVMGTVVVVLILKRQLISVRPARDASRYVVDNSLHLRSSHDIFLYSHVTQTRRPQQDDDSGPGGGGGIHMSSSGSNHGGGGF
jgi:uncharacterized protein